MKSFKEYLTEQNSLHLDNYDTQASTKLGQLLYICTAHLDRVTELIDNLNEKEQLTDSQEEKLGIYETLQEYLTTAIESITRLGYIHPIKVKTGSISNIADTMDEYNSYIQELQNIISPAPQADVTSPDDGMKKFRQRAYEANDKRSKLRREIEDIVEKYQLQIVEDGVGWHGGKKVYLITFKGNGLPNNYRGEGGYGSVIDNSPNTPPEYRVTVIMSEVEAYEQALEFLKTSLGIEKPKPVVPEDPKEAVVQFLDDLSSTLTDISNSI